MGEYNKARILPELYSLCWIYYQWDLHTSIHASNTYEKWLSFHNAVVISWRLDVNALDCVIWFQMSSSQVKHIQIGQANMMDNILQTEGYPYPKHKSHQDGIAVLHVYMDGKKLLWKQDFHLNPVCAFDNIMEKISIHQNETGWLE